MAAAHTTSYPQGIHDPVTKSIITQLTCLNAIRSLIREDGDYASLSEPQKNAVDSILSIAEEAAGLCSSLTKL